VTEPVTARPGSPRAALYQGRRHPGTRRCQQEHDIGHQCTWKYKELDKEAESITDTGDHPRSVTVTSSNW
jgi:hypothetical protein